LPAASSPRAGRGRVATVAVNSFVFKQPVLIGDLVTFYAEITRVGRTSVTVAVEVYAQRNPTDLVHRQGDRGEPHLRGDRRDRRPAKCRRSERGGRRFPVLQHLAQTGAAFAPDQCGARAGRCTVFK